MRKTTAALIATGTLITGAIAGYALAPYPTQDAPHKVLVTPVQSACDNLASNILGMADVMLTAWEANTEYRPEFRTDNVDAYRDIVNTCGL